MKGGINVGAYTLTGKYIYTYVITYMYIQMSIFCIKFQQGFSPWKRNDLVVFIALCLSARMHWRQAIHLFLKQTSHLTHLAHLTPGQILWLLREK